MCLKFHHKCSLYKVNNCTRALWRCRSFIDLSLAKRLYSSLVEPHFLYACSHYDGGSRKSANTIQVAQNKALKAVLSVDSRISTESLHSRLQIPFVSDICKYQVACHTYKGLHDMSVPDINAVFTPVDRQMGLCSEQSLNMVSDRCRTVFGGKSLCQRGYVYWSQLPSDVKNS